MINRNLLRRYTAAAAMFATGVLGILCVFTLGREADSTESAFDQLKDAARDALLKIPLDGLYVRLNLTEGNYTEWHDQYATVVKSHLKTQTFDVKTERSLRSIRRVVLEGLPRHSLIFDAKALVEKLMWRMYLSRMFIKFALPVIAACFGLATVFGLLRLFYL